MATLLRGVKLSDLASASPQETSRQVERLFQDALTPTRDQVDEQMDSIDAKIREFERKHEMPSAVMRQNLKDGVIKETAEICSWLMLLKMRSRFDACKNNSSAY